MTGLYSCAGARNTMKNDRDTATRRENVGMERIWDKYTLNCTMAEYIKCPSWFHRLPSIYKLIISLGAATIVSAGLMPVRMENMTRIMIGWDVFSICMLIISVVIFSSMRPRQIRLLAKQEDAGRIVVFGIVLATTIGSLMGVMVLLGNKVFLLGKGLESFIYLAGVVCSWFL